MANWLLAGRPSVIEPFCTGHSFDLKKTGILIFPAEALEDMAMISQIAPGPGDRINVEICIFAYKSLTSVV